MISEITNLNACIITHCLDGFVISDNDMYIAPCRNESYNTSKELDITSIPKPFVSEDQALEYLATILVQAYIQHKIS